jgi:hypothetical protein
MLIYSFLFFQCFRAVLKLGSMSSPNLFFFKVALPILSPLHFSVSFRASLSACKEASKDFDGDTLDEKISWGD